MAGRTPRTGKQARGALHMYALQTVASPGGAVRGGATEKQVQSNPHSLACIKVQKSIVGWQTNDIGEIYRYLE